MQMMMVSFQQIIKITESVIMMQDAILVLCTTDSDLNKQQRVNKVAEKIKQNREY